jgi:hypothetical protein
MAQNKTIATLSSDIYGVLDATVEHTPDADIAAAYAMRIGGEFAKATLKRDKPRELGKLWASDLGKKCLRQPWFKFNLPTSEAPLLGHTKFKFLYGNILEEAVLYMAEEAGHTIAYPQERVATTVGDWDISGRIDCTIDGILVDVKSTSSYGYQRYKHGINASNDSFGYLQQLGFYQAFGKFERSADEQGFVWVDKQNGHVSYTAAPVEKRVQLEERAARIIDAIGRPTIDMVPRGYAPEAYGKSGNECLPIGCSYCPFKKECWKDSNGGKGLRTFAYNHKPVDFVTIVREPKVPEIT